MKFYIKNHTIVNEKVRKDLLILHITDLHISNTFDFAILKELIEKVSIERPNIICLTGDLLDQAKFGYDGLIKMLIKDYFSLLAEIAPIYIVKGNHDLLDKYDNNEWLFHSSNSFFNFLCGIDNVHVLSGNNFMEVYGNVALTGFDYSNHIEDSIRTNESKEVFFKYIANRLLHLSVNHDYFNLLLLHSPKYLDLLRKIKFDLILTGHMHNGGLPNFLDRIIPGNRGFISPCSLELFPKNARGITRIGDTPLVIGTPLNTSPKIYKRELIRELYRPGVTYINVKSK